MASKERYDALRAMDLDHAAATYGAEHADNVDEALDLAFAFANGEIGQEEARVSGGEPHIDAAQPHHSEDDATMAMLMDMGFPADRATEAAQLHKTDFEAALAYCTDYDALAAAQAEMEDEDSSDDDGSDAGAGAGAGGAGGMQHSNLLHRNIRYAASLSISSSFTSPSALKSNSISSIAPEHHQDDHQGVALFPPG
jgi:hypothetical protein